MLSKVRFAPSPTGLLHVGNARIAVVNNLFARKIGAKFLLRIDDTDKERSKQEYVDAILQDLEWLGIQYDEFFRQSDKLDRYESIKDRLLSEGILYKCYESVEELEYKRKLALSRGQMPVYDRASLKLTEEEVRRYETLGTPYCIRFKLPDITVSWSDLVVGDVAYNLSNVSDPIIIKADGSYLYSFCSVIDDIDSGITHIIRGQDHITNTAIQIAMFEHITGKQCEVQFAHLSLLMEKDGSQLSKRFGSSSLGELRDSGIHPMAVNNVLSTFGSSKNVQHFIHLDDLVEYFEINSFGTNSPKFDYNVLEMTNKKILHQMQYEQLLAIDPHTKITKEQYNVVSGNISNLNEYNMWTDILSIGYQTHHKTQNAQLIDDFVNELKSSQPKSSDEFDCCIKNISLANNLKGRDLYIPLRLSITGVDCGPHLADICCLLGLNDVERRLRESL